MRIVKSLIMNRCRSKLQRCSSELDKIKRGRRYLKAKRTYMLMSSSFCNMGILEWLSFGLYMIISVLVILYIARNLNETALPIFELAKISAILGGLVLAGGFFTTSPQELKFKMRRIGALYLLATIAFVILGLALPIFAPLTEEMSYYLFFFILVIGSLIVSAVAFALATSGLTVLIPKFLRKE